MFTIHPNIYFHRLRMRYAHSSSVQQPIILLMNKLTQVHALRAPLTQVLNSLSQANYDLKKKEKQIIQKTQLLTKRSKSINITGSYARGLNFFLKQVRPIASIRNGLYGAKLRKSLACFLYCLQAPLTRGGPRLVLFLIYIYIFFKSDKKLRTSKPGCSDNGALRDIF